MTPEQHKAAVQVHRQLVQRGMDPGDASVLVLRAIDRLLVDGGMGKSAQTRRLDRTGLPPRYVSPAERCVRFDQDPANEESSSIQIRQYQDQGWNVSRIEPYKGQVIWYACPPGQVPMEHQQLILQASSE